jgi:TonB family protein
VDGEEIIESDDEVVTVDDDEEIIVLEEYEIEYVDDVLEALPEIIEFVEAQYPEELIREGVEGAVLLLLIVDEDGAVDSISIAQPLHPALDASAMEAVRQFRFSPARANGENVAVMLHYEYRFSLSDAVSIPDIYVNFSGRVLERGTRRPVAEALVVLQFIDDTPTDTTLSMPFHLYMEQIGKIDGQDWEDSRLITVTDETGSFRFYSLPSGAAQVRILSPEHESFIYEINTDRFEEVKMTSFVPRLDYSDFELVVYGRAEETEVSRHRITITEIKKIPGLGGDIGRVVQAMPGVARPTFGGTAVAVRGAPNWATSYFIDGVWVPALYHMGGLNSIYPSEAIEAIDFFPGGFSVRYGSAVGGVIEMTGRRPKTDRLQGHVDMSMLNGAVFLEGPINENVSFMASVRRDFTGDLLKLYFKHAAPENTAFAMAPFFRDHLFRVDVDINKDHRLFVSLIGSRDSVGIFVPAVNVGTNEIGGSMDEMNTVLKFHTLTAGLESRLNDRWKNSLRLSGTYARMQLEMFGMMNFEEKPLFGHLRNQASYTASENMTVNIGADVRLINENLILATITGQNMIVRDTISNWLFGTVGGYVNVEWKPIDRLLLVPGLRYDYFVELDYDGSVVPPFWDYGFMDNRRGLSGEPSFRISGRYQLTDEHTLKAAVGTYSQTPEPMGMVIHELIGEPTLPATKATHYVIGHEWQISDLLSLDVQTYYNQLWDIPRSYNGNIDYDPNLEIQKNYFSDGRGRNYGLELMLRHSRSDKFFGWISYTLARSQTWSKVDGKYILSNRDEPHHLQLLGSWNLRNNWDAGVRTRFVSGKPTSPIIGTVEDVNNKTINPIYGERNSERLDPFFQLDFRVDKRVIYDKWMLTYYVDLQNMLWPIYKSPELVFYNYNYTESQKISMIPMVSVGVRVEF